MSVEKSDEKLLIFASLISTSKIVLFKKKYQAFDTVIHHQTKYLVKILPCASYFQLSSGDETLSLMFDTLLQITKW